MNTYRFRTKDDALTYKAAAERLNWTVSQVWHAERSGSLPAGWAVTTNCPYHTP